MSLFENDQYQWRETCFVMFQASRRPAAQTLVEMMNNLGKQVQTEHVVANEAGLVESLTVFSPEDYAAMDISYVEGDEVAEHLQELATELTAETDEEKELLARLPTCTARLDIYHFEKRVSAVEEDDFLDPGGLLSVLQLLAELCDGIPIDPQTGILV